MSKKEIEELEELNNYLMENIGINSLELVGHIFTFKKNANVEVRATPKYYDHSISFSVIIKQGTRIKILKPCCSVEFGSMKDRIIFEILEPQMIIAANKLQITMEEFTESIK